MKLDRDRPFGTIHPHYNGAAFEQDGIFFDVYERALPGQAKAKAEPAKPARKAKDEAKDEAKAADAAPAGEPVPTAAPEAEPTEGTVIIGQSAPDPRAKG